MKKITVLAGSLLLGMAAVSHAQDLRIGMQDDPDTLDPHRSRTYAARIVFTSLCDKLVDIDSKLQFVPKLAKSWSWSEDGLQLTRSEEHTSELQSLMRISYAVFCLKKKKKK